MNVAIKPSLYLCMIGLNLLSAHAFLTIVRRCGFTPRVNNARTVYNSSSNTGGYNITYVCHDGYHLVGDYDTIECVCNNFIDCQIRLNGLLPKCQPDGKCIKIPHPPHGHVVYDSHHLTANYSCNTGYVLIGPKTRRCDPNGQWSGDEPKCDAVPKLSALRCRACDQVKHLDQCNRIITCSDGEECYTEHLINDVTRMSVFTSGCRPKQDCSVPSNITSGSTVVNCSECCADLNSPLGCNTDLCSFREHSGGISTHCLHCELENSIADCNNITACDSTQMCITSTVIFGLDHKITAGCYKSNTCLTLIKSLFESKDKRAITQDRRRSTFHSCDICCGDEGCNNDTCENVKERIAYLYQHGNLDLQTLRANGTSIF